MKRAFATVTMLVAVSATALEGQTSHLTSDRPAPGPVRSGNTAERTRGSLTVPAWFHVNHAARTVVMRIAAAQDVSHISWNFNGYMNGSGTIIVPQGYKITIVFENDDAMAHSIGVAEHWMTEPPARPVAVPAFPGAISSNPTSFEGATKEDSSETLSFEASRPGRYVLMCFVPSYAAGGMWVNFDVLPGQEAGVRDERM